MTEQKKDIVIRVHRKTAAALVKLKVYRKETYDEVIERLIKVFVERKV